MPSPPKRVIPATEVQVGDKVHATCRECHALIDGEVFSSSTGSVLVVWNHIPLYGPGRVRVANHAARPAWDDHVARQGCCSGK